VKEDTFQPRSYRHWIEGKDLVPFDVTVKETDLYIRASSNLQRKAHRLVLKYRYQLEGYIKRNPAFQKSLEPLPISENAPAIVRQMAEKLAWDRWRRWLVLLRSVSGVSC